MLLFQQNYFNCLHRHSLILICMISNTFLTHSLNNKTMNPTDKVLVMPDQKIERFHQYLITVGLTQGKLD